MNLARLSLATTAAAFAGFGVAFLAKPTAMTRKVDILAKRPNARTEIRAMYGGMEIGLAAFFASAAASPEWHRPALVAQACAIGGLAVGRFVGMAADESGTLMKSLFVAEATAAATALEALAQSANSTFQRKSERQNTPQATRPRARASS